MVTKRILKERCRISKKPVTRNIIGSEIHFSPFPLNSASAVDAFRNTHTTCVMNLSWIEVFRLFTLYHIYVYRTASRIKDTFCLIFINVHMCLLTIKADSKVQTIYIVGYILVKCEWFGYVRSTIKLFG